MAPVSPGVLSPDLAPGIEEIYEESQQVFLAPGHPQDGQVIFYKVSRHRPPLTPASCPTPILNTHMPWQITVDRGLKWEEAYTRSLELTGPHDGFYLSYKVGRPWGRTLGLGKWGQCWKRGTAEGGSSFQPHPLQHTHHGNPHLGCVPVCPNLTRPPAQARGNKPSCLLAEQNRSNLFTVYKPNIGRQSQLETFDSLCRKFYRVGMGAGRRQAGPQDAHVPGLMYLYYVTLPRWGFCNPRPALCAQPSWPPGEGCQI